MNGRRVLYATMPLLVVIVKRDGSSYLLPYDWGKKPPFTSFDHPGTIRVPSRFLTKDSQRLRGRIIPHAVNIYVVNPKSTPVS